METNDTLITAYLQGELTAEERASFEQQMDESPALRKEVEDFRFILYATDNLRKQRQVDVEGRWKKLSRLLYWMRLRKQVGILFRRTAAILFIPLLIATAYLFTPGEAQAPETIEVTSAYGVISRVTLPDGSVVSLNSGSTLRYPRYFNEPTRRVALTGEAYFTVESDKAHCFEVSLPGNITVQAYGTEFNITAYENQDAVETVLVNGSVNVSRTDDPVVNTLTPGQQLTTYINRQEPAVFSEANVYAKTAWKDGKIVFRRTRMEAVAATLSRHFNVDIELQGEELSQYEYSATFVTESLQDVLALLSQSAPIRWQIIEPIKQQDNSYSRRKVIISLGNRKV